jgi:hypothetical protein
MSIRSIALAGLAAFSTAGAQAEGLTWSKFFLFDKTPSAEDHYRLVASPATLHYSYSDNHRRVWMLGAEKQYADGDLVGAAYFSNSFGQDCVTVYRGERLRNWSPYEKLFAQWTAGVMYGYKAPYQDEIPLNFKGFSPIAVLTLGWQFTPKYSAQVNVLGLAGLMFQVSMNLP